MARSGTTDGPRVPGLVRSPAARLAAPLLLLVLLVVIDEAAGPQIRIGGLMIAVHQIDRPTAFPLLRRDRQSGCRQWA